MADNMAERLADLEVRYAFLEKHVGEQDRAMLEMADRIDRIEARLRLLGDRLDHGDDSSMPANERPPHY